MKLIERASSAAAAAMPAVLRDNVPLPNDKPAAARPLIALQVSTSFASDTPHQHSLSVTPLHAQHPSPQKTTGFYSSTSPFQTQPEYSRHRLRAPDLWGIRFPRPHLALRLQVPRKPERDTPREGPGEEEQGL